VESRAPLSAWPIVRRSARLLLLTALAFPAEAMAQRQALPSSSLAVESGSRWMGWWSSRHAPVRWSASHPAISSSIRWSSVRPGVEHAELRLEGKGEAWRIRGILLRIDPQRFEFRLRSVVSTDGTMARWNTDSLSIDAVIGFNSGHFEGGTSWGWVVVNGDELQPPGSGSLPMALVVSEAGDLRLVEPDQVEAVRRAGGVMMAMQSYPMLLERDGFVPEPLRRPGRGVDLLHRDSRLAIGETRDGSILVALTRFEGLGGVLSELPFGLTVPETAALMGALGCRRAMLLDGGISGQLAIRDMIGETRRWRGLRRVPLAVEVVPRGG
jgi:hypothetical protein